MPPKKAEKQGQPNKVKPDLVRSFLAPPRRSSSLTRPRNSTVIRAQEQEGRKGTGTRKGSRPPGGLDGEEQGDGAFCLLCARRRRPGADADRSAYRRRRRRRRTRSRRRRRQSSGRRTSSRACSLPLISFSPRSLSESVRPLPGLPTAGADACALTDPKTVLCAFFKAGRCQKGELMRLAFSSFAGG